MIAECESPPRVLNRIGRRLQPVSGPILLGLLCLLVYNANLRQIAAVREHHAAQNAGETDDEEQRDDAGAASDSENDWFHG